MNLSSHIVKMTIFQPKINFLSANSRFTVQNGATYLPRMTMKTCIYLKLTCGQFHQKFYEHICANILAPKNFKTLNVSTKELHVKLLYEKAARKMLVKLTPEHQRMM